MTSVDLSETANWQNHEIESLLNIWSKKDIQNELGNMHQNLPVYEKISTQLASLGINRSAISCRDKIKKLKFKYRRIREKKGYRKSSFKFYDILRSVLGDNIEEGGDGYPQHVPHQPRPHPHHGDQANGHGSHYYPQEYDKSRFSPSVISNDNNSTVLSDSDSESEYDYLKGDLSDDDYLHEEMSSQYSEAQPSSSATQQTANPVHDSGGAGSYGNMFMHGGPSGTGRFPSSSKTDSVPKDDPATFWQQMNTGPLNAARMTMRRRGDCMRGGFGFDRGFGMMHHPFNPFMGHGHRLHRGGRGGGRKRARLEQTFDLMLNKVSQIQKDLQDRFLASHEKQQQQHFNFELQRQEIENRHREAERKHEMDMFQLMVSSLHQHGNQFNHAFGNNMVAKHTASTPNSPPTTFPGKPHTMSLEEVKATWRTADIVCFDVDSTVCKDEGLDELAGFCGVGEQVAAWTRKAMGGDVSFRVALSERLNIVKPSRQQLQDFIANHPPQLSDGMSDLVSALRQKGRIVYLVSGGFKPIIEPAAHLLSIPTENIFANQLKFSFTGDYAGFDEDQPTSDSGGKPRVMQMIKDRHKDNKLVMIGDGATDLEAAPPADAFIGYGGNVVRESVKSRAAWFVTDFQELITELNSAS